MWKTETGDGESSKSRRKGEREEGRKAGKQAGRVGTLVEYEDK